MPGPSQGHAQTPPRGQGSGGLPVSSAWHLRQVGASHFPSAAGNLCNFPSKLIFVQAVNIHSWWKAPFTAIELTAELPGRREPRKKTCKSGIRKWPRQQGTLAPPPHSCMMLLFLATAARNGRFSRVRIVSESEIHDGGRHTAHMVI